MVTQIERLRSAAAVLLELLLPSVCAACGGAVEGDASLCHVCDARLPRLPLSACTLCQEAAALPPGDRCTRCARRRGPLDACVAAVRFSDVEDWIHRFKYPNGGLRGLDPAPRAVLRALVVEAARRAPGPTPDLVVPIPLHPRRLRARGFNPAALLAADVARARSAPRDAVALRRTRDTPSQTGLARGARRRNVKGAFQPRGRRRVPETVWLVDDVVTTGSTLEACARALRLSGARHVIGIAAARATTLEL